MMDIGDGWFVDEGDPSVGLFGDLVFHNDCPDVDGDDDPLTPEHSTTVTNSESIVGIVIVVDQYTCPCGAIKTMTSQEPAEDFEEPRSYEDD